MTLSMLRREELHSLNTSGMQVAWSAAEGLNSAKAEVVEDAKRAKLTAAITFFLMVFMTFPRSLGSLANRGCSYELTDGRMAEMPRHKNGTEGTPAAANRGQCAYQVVEHRYVPPRQLRFSGWSAWLPEWLRRVKTGAFLLFDLAVSAALRFRAEDTSEPMH
jgi:hypothetical protein